jgi:ceramide glucosyltransferase
MLLISNLLFWLLQGPRLYFAKLYAQRRKPSLQTPLDVTILQPILGGDPLLKTCLERNATQNPQAKFLWLVDTEDTIGQQAAIEAKQPNVEIVIGPGPQDGENPKLAKLIRALPSVTTKHLIVLDDDTILPANSLGTLCAHLELDKGLVTGLPVFKTNNTFWEKLLGGFINGNAYTTYFPVAALSQPQSINGMIYAANTAQLKQLGGFAAAGHCLTDDYAMALLYRKANLPITQANAEAEVHITVDSAAHFARLMRRWMIFANHFFQHNRSLIPFLIAGLPAFLPLFYLSLMSHFIYCLILRQRADPIFHFLASLTVPFFFLSALILPNQLSWRNRKIQLNKGAIHYR